MKLCFKTSFKNSSEDKDREEEGIRITSLLLDNSTSYLIQGIGSTLCSPTSVNSIGAGT